MKVYFISGTDTGVGKTLVSALFCRFLIKQGNKTAYVKPVQTGDVSDAAFVQKVCGEELQSFTARHYELPASPHLSAPLEDKKVVLNDVVNDIQKFASEISPDVLVLEGAGGLSVPLNEKEDMIDLCKAFNAELIIVSRAGLGTLNHTFLTLNYARQYGLNPSVIISGCSSDADIIEKDNINMIRQMSDGRLIGLVPIIAGVDTEEMVISDLPEISFNL